MKNVLFKNNLMSKGKTSEIFINFPDRGYLEYDYQFTKSLSQDQVSYNEIYFHKSMPTNITTLNYEGTKFNMITCPAGGRVNIVNWGWKEIKEPFMLGETEVTQELFEAVMGFNNSSFKTFYDVKDNRPVCIDAKNNPVEGFTWFDCLEFCNRLSDYFDLNCCYRLKNKRLSTAYGKNALLSIENANVTFVEGANGFRLPKEWEWQIAAMAGTNNQYAGANDDESLKRVAWLEANSENTTHPVAQKLPNEWGFYDMSGNLNEWCENSISPQDNNKSSAERVYHGGFFSSSSSRSLWTSARISDEPKSRGREVGFRVARSISPFSK
jgi:formylglycine-generating enzyme required for sulfatase activity